MPDLSITDIFIASLVAYVAECYGVLVGGNSFLIQPVLILLGVPPAAAIANDVASNIGSVIGVAPTYLRKQFIDWRVLLWWLPGMVIGSYGGSYLLPHIPGWILEKTLGVLALLSVAHLLIKRSAAKTHPHENRWTRRLAVPPLSLVMGAYLGFSGAGMGTIYRTTVAALHDLPLKKTLGTLNMSLAPMLVGAVTNYAKDGLLYLPLLLPMMFSCFLAGLTGGYVARRIDERHLRTLFIVIGTGFGVWLLLR